MFCDQDDVWLPNKIENKTVDNTQNLLNLENKRKQILASIKYTKEDM